eukprot:s794_g4.t1
MEHRKMHPDPKHFASKCPRCKYLVHRQSWRQSIASVQLPGSKQMIWLNEKPARLGLSWGIGCDVCASMLARLVAHPSESCRPCSASSQSESLKQRLNTKWGRYEISSMSSEAFGGAVPQLEDYLRVWRYVKSSQSFKSMEATTFTEAFISQKRAEPQEVKRRAVTQIVKVLREQVRRRKVAALLQATTMTIIVDDKKDHRAILFHSNCGAGLVQVLRIGESSIAAHEDDYAARMADSIDRGLQLLATPLFGDVDPWVYTHLKEILRHFTADGCPAAQKAGRILTETFPNLTLVHRDHCHAIRRGMVGSAGNALTLTLLFGLCAERPCQAQETWAEVRNLLFGSGGLVPEVMNSVEWRSKFWAIQKDVEACEGWRKPLQVALKHLNFSQVRWNSQDAPLRRFAAMIVPIALLLAIQSQDRRQSRAFQAKCEQMLQRLTPDLLLTVGIASDYSSEMIRFLRQFDTADHDPAKTHRQKADMLHRPGQFSNSAPDRLKVLFFQNHIFDEAEGVQTVTRLICEQAMECPPIHYGPRVHELWPEASKNDIKKCVYSMHAVVDATIAEIDSEIRGFALDFAVFDLVSFHHGKKDAAAWKNFEMLTNARLERLLRSGLRHPDWAAACREWWGAAHQLHADYKDSFLSGEEVDNRKAWQSTLTADFAAKVTESGKFQSLTTFVEYYLGFLDTSTGAERALSKLAKIHACHLGPLEDGGVTVSMLLDIAMDGPEEEKDFCHRSFLEGDESPQLRATDLSLELADIWRSAFGSRFRLYKTRNDKGKVRAKKQGTEVSIVRCQAQATDKLVRHISKQVSAKSPTVLGLSRDALPEYKAREQNPAQCGLESVYASAAKRKEKKEEEKKHRSLHPEKTCYQANRRTCQLLSRQVSPEAFFYVNKLSLQVLDLCPTPLSNASQHGSTTFIRLAVGISMVDLIKSVRRAHLVVIPSWRTLRGVPDSGKVAS